MTHARIGKVRMKASAEVIPMRRGLTVTRDRKAEFVNHLGQCFDSYAHKYGEEPEATVIVLLGLKQGAEAYWTIRGDSQGGGTSVLALAQAAITREIVSPD